MNDKKDIQYKILKSEACGHTIEYKMVKKEHELEKARIDEGLSPREKMKAREARSSKEREPKELNPDQYETAKKIARTKTVTETGEKQRKQTLKDALHTQKQNRSKSPSKEDLEYPMAASEEDCKCEDKTEKCECEDKEMKKREKFYIQKIQELRKQMVFSPGKAQIGGGSALPVQNPTGLTSEQQKMAADNLNSITSNMGANLARDMRSNYDRQQKYGTISQAPQQSSAKDLKDTKIPAKTLIEENSQKPRSEVFNEKGKPTTSVGQDPTPEQFYKLNPNLKPTAPTATSAEAPATATSAEAPAPKYDMKNPYKVENAKNFKDAFNQARKATGGGGNVFEYGGKKYHTYTQDEFKNPEKSGVPTDNKFYKDWQAKKDVTGPGAYYANKMNPTAAAPASAQTSTAQPAGQTSQPLAQQFMENAKEQKAKIGNNENATNPAAINPAFAREMGVSKPMNIRGGKQGALTPYKTSSPDTSFDPNAEQGKQFIPNSSAIEAAPSSPQNSKLLGKQIG